jgi:hypothetical protein
MADSKDRKQPAPDHSAAAGFRPASTHPTISPLRRSHAFSISDRTRFLITVAIPSLPTVRATRQLSPRASSPRHLSSRYVDDQAGASSSDSSDEAEASDADDESSSFINDSPLTPDSTQPLNPYFSQPTASSQTDILDVVFPAQPVRTYYTASTPLMERCSLCGFTTLRGFCDCP